MSRFHFETDKANQVARRDVFAVLWPLFRARLAHFTGAFVLLATAAGLMVLGPVLVKRAIDVDIQGGDWNGLKTTAFIYLAVQLVHMAVFYVMRNWVEWAGQEMMAELKRKLFRHLMRLPMAFFDRHPPGRLLSRVENDTEALRMLFTTASVLLLGDLLLFVGMFVVMFLVSPRLTLVLGVLIPVLLWGAIFVQRRIRPLFLDVRGITAEICARLAEFLQGVPVLQAFGRRDWAARNFQEVNRRRFEVSIRGETVWLAWFNTIILTETVAFALVLGVGGVWALQGAVTIGTLVMFMGYIRRFFEPVLRLSDQLVIIQKALAGGERVAELLSEPVTIADAASKRQWTGLNRGVTFENVWFRYGDRGVWVLKEVSFTLPAGERWAVVGPTGAGKTTLISLLLRFYEPERGRILLDGVDIREIPQEELRKRIGLVLQDLYLFPTDLRTNLNLGREVRDGAMKHALRLTAADRVVARLPQGLDSELAERGANLSMGERQLFSFTRAVVHDPSLLILDEATSAIDPATEARIEESMRHILEGRTALIIAHRLSTIRSCDRILVLEDGEIVEAGNHEALVAEDGLYRRLHELQLEEESHVAELTS